MVNEPKNILVVDDEVLILESIKSQLERLGNHQVNVLLADCEEEAHTIIDSYHSAEKRIDALLCDLMIPDGHPEHIITHFRLCFESDLLFILTGMHDNHPDIQILKQKHPIQVIHKPWNPNELKAVLK